MLILALIVFAKCEDMNILTPNDEFEALFQAYIKHFKKNYATPEERQWRKNILYERLKSFAVSDVPLREQVPFHTTQFGQPVLMPFFIFPETEDDHALISEHSDLSDEERIEKFSVKMTITKKHRERSKNTLKKLYPQFSHVIEKFGVGKNSLYFEVSKGKFIRQKIKKSNKGKEGKNAAKSDEELFLDTILPKQKETLGKLSSWLDLFADKSKNSTIESRLLAQDLAQQKIRGYISSEKEYLGGYEFKKYISFKYNLPAIRNQMGCRACYAFSVVELVTLVFNIRYNTDFVFSVAGVIDCAAKRRYHCKGCFGGDMMGAIDYINDKGISHESEYPFRGRAETCNKEVRRYPLTINHIEFEPKTSLIITALERAPLIMPIYITNHFSYILDGRSIVYHNYCPYRDTKHSHAIVILGHHIKKGNSKKLSEMSYLIGRNPWSEQWAEKGYIKMAFKNSDIENLFPCVMSRRKIIQMAVTG